jgi:glutathionylspermidine synthase
VAAAVTPWVTVPPLSDADFVGIRRRAIFDCNKWDPQVGDVGVVARAPLVMRAAAWTEVSRLAEALAGETLSAEAELANRPDLHRRLGLPRAVRRALAGSRARRPSVGAARLIRFDFHHTDDGWRISEANSDVPGGLNEASGFAALMAPHYPALTPTGDPAGAYAAAIVAATTATSPVIALIHATAYSDDQQMMVYLARGLASLGVRTHLASPAHVRWRRGRAYLDSAWWCGPLDAVVRFFPSDWLTILPAATGWPHFFTGGLTPVSNPATAILTQTKRFPLVWGEIDTPLPTWRRLLPETRDPRDVAWRNGEEWIVKPALGRVGEGVGVMDALETREQRAIRRSAWLWPRHWIAQRRFRTLPVDSAVGPSFPCLGVYVVNTRAVGAYGRLAPRPLIDSRASDAAVLQAA